MFPIESLVAQLVKTYCNAGGPWLDPLDLGRSPWRRQCHCLSILVQNPMGRGLRPRCMCLKRVRHQLFNNTTTMMNIVLKDQYKLAYLRRQCVLFGLLSRTLPIMQQQQLLAYFRMGYVDSQEMMVKMNMGKADTLLEELYFLQVDLRRQMAGSRGSSSFSF